MTNIERRQTTAPCLLYAAPAGLVMSTPYDAAFVAEFKARVPSADRTWRAADKAWIIAPKHGPAVAKLIETFFMCRVAVPAASSAPPAPEVRSLRLDYLGRCKDRDDGTSAAYGSTGGAWSLVFPESVLRAYFHSSRETAKAGPPTLYEVLAVAETADDTAIKASWRRLVKQWHPDRCREPDARPRFEAIQAAYEVLADPAKRRKYGAGLLFQRSAASPFAKGIYGGIGSADYQDGYRAPLRCGVVLASVVPVVGRLVVGQILDWSDILDARGRTLIVSWPAGADTWTEAWQ